MSSGKFKFPAATYYEQSESMHTKVTDFADEMDLNFFDVVSSNVGSLSYKDQGIVERPVNQGKQKHRTLTNSFVKKWKNMKSEQSQNPMYGVVEVDQKYKTTFSELSNGEQQKKIQAKQDDFERTVLTTIMGDYDVVEDMEKMLEMMQDGADSDLYSRIQQVTSLGSFFKDFEKKFGEFADRNPEKAAKILEEIKSNKKLNTLYENVRNSDLYKKLRDSAKMGKTGAFNKWMSRAKNMVNGKFIRTGVSFGKKFLKGPWGTIVNSGFHGYDNFTSEEVQQNYEDGQYVRGTAKAAVGTTLDVISDVGPIDGALIGAATGGLPGLLIGAGAGAVNQGVQFFFPNAYDGAKEFANSAIDWTADTATKGWNAAKDFGKESWDRAVELKDDIGQGIQNKVDSVVNTANNIKEGAEKLGKTVGKGLELAKKGKDLWDSFKPSFLT